jgi:hypothetical protein
MSGTNLASGNFHDRGAARLAEQPQGAGRGSRINLHGSCHASYQEHAIWHLINVDTRGHPLCKTHPGEDRICRREPCLLRLCVREVDVTSDATDMATNELAVDHRSDGVLDRA